jgi:hypothetical protein
LGRRSVHRITKIAHLFNKPSFEFMPHDVVLPLDLEIFNGVCPAARLHSVAHFARLVGALAS